MIKLSRKFALILLASTGIAGCRHGKSFDDNIRKIGHVVVIYMENHSFNNLYGEFEGANGLSNAREENVIQVDKIGKRYDFLPQIPRSSEFPVNMKNDYFNIDQYIPSDKRSPDATHLFYHQQMQINGGKMNMFAAYNHTGGMTMGYYRTKYLPLYSFAKQYTLCDNFFQSGFGGSFFNHIFLIAADAPVWKEAPPEIVAALDSSGRMIKNGLVTPDGYAVNTVFPMLPPRPPRADSSRLLPPQTMPTIGDRLSGKGVSWAWYGGDWNKAVEGKPSLYAYNHGPFAYFEKYGPGTEGREKHLKDEIDFLDAAKAGKLPAVSFVKPSIAFDEHPGYAAVYSSEEHAVELINAVLKGPQADSALIILTYDENGGFWDHVAPPKIDRWGPGVRIPAIIMGPFAKKEFIDTTQYETVSILSFIEKRWDLEPLTERDKNASPLINALEF